MSKWVNIAPTDIPPESIIFQAENLRGAFYDQVLVAEEFRNDEDTYILIDRHSSSWKVLAYKRDELLHKAYWWWYQWGRWPGEGYAARVLSKFFRDYFTEAEWVMAALEYLGG